MAPIIMSIEKTVLSTRLPLTKSSTDTDDAGCSQTATGLDVMIANQVNGIHRAKETPETRLESTIRRYTINIRHNKSTSWEGILTNSLLIHKVNI